MRPHGQSDFDELTTCWAANRAFKSHDDSKIRQVSQFITHVLEKLDRDYGVVVEAAILNDGLTEVLVAATRGACAQHEGLATSIEICGYCIRRGFTVLVHEVSGKPGRNTAFQIT
jgi:hypothetical protein